MSSILDGSCEDFLFSLNSLVYRRWTGLREVVAGRAVDSTTTTQNNNNKPLLQIVEKLRMISLWVWDSWLLSPEMQLSSDFSFFLSNILFFIYF